MEIGKIISLKIDGEQSLYQVTNRYIDGEGHQHADIRKYEPYLDSDVHVSALFIRYRAILQELKKLEPVDYGLLVQKHESVLNSTYAEYKQARDRARHEPVFVRVTTEYDTEFKCTVKVFKNPVAAHNSIDTNFRNTIIEVPMP